MKKYFLYGALVVAAAFAVLLPRLMFPSHQQTDAEISQSILSQKIIAVTDKMEKRYKLYQKDKLVGYVDDPKVIDQFLAEEYKQNYQADFPDSKLNLSEDYYMQEEYSNLVTENIDQDIIAHLKKENSFSIYVHEISFADENGVFARIFVKNIEDFETAKKRFLLNFVDEEALKRFEQGLTTEELDGYGTREVSLQVKDKIIVDKAYSDPKKVFTNSNQIFDYLCYGENKERKYYIVEQGDTLEGVSAKNGNISTKLLVLINPETLTKTNQILKPGTKINITYFTSPLSVYVRKETLRAEPVYPPTPLYIEDEQIFKGKEIVDTKAENGTKNVLYEEMYINGVLQPQLSKTRSSTKIKEPIQAVIRVGTKVAPDRGTGDYIWPIESPTISCMWFCYFNHRALDLINYLNPHPVIHAADNGVVVESGYNGNWGYLVKIDHNNGYQTLYAHMFQESDVKVGDVVQRGDPIGIVGSTGLSYGPHLHWELYDAGERVDPCMYVACETLPRNDR